MQKSPDILGGFLICIRLTCLIIFPVCHFDRNGASRVMKWRNPLTYLLKAISLRCYLMRNRNDKQAHQAQCSQPIDIISFAEVF